MTRLKYKRLDSLGNKSRPVLKAGPFGSSVKKESYVDSGFKVYGQQEVLSGNLGAKNYYINQEIFDRHKNCSVQAGDILITMMGTVGKVLVIPSEHEPGIINPRLMRVSLDSTKVNPEFVKSFLEMPKLQKLLERRSHGGTMPGLNAEAIASIKVPVPDLKYQNYAVQVFALWDTAIEKTEALIVTKERQFGYLRTNIIKNTKNIASKKFSGFLEESRILDTVNNPEKRLTVRLHLKGVDVREYRGTEKECATQYFMRKAGQLIYGKQNIFRGSIGIIPHKLEGYSSSQDIPAFDINKGVNADWLYWYMSRPCFYERLEHFSAGSGSKRLHPKELFKMCADVPPIEEQERIAHTLNTAQKEITLLKMLADQYRTQKHGLMQKLLSGQWHAKNKEVKI